MFTGEGRWIGKRRYAEMSIIFARIEKDPTHRATARSSLHAVHISTPASRNEQTGIHKQMRTIQRAEQKQNMQLPNSDAGRVVAGKRTGALQRTLWRLWGRHREVRRRWLLWNVTVRVDHGGIQLSTPRKWEGPAPSSYPLAHSSLAQYVFFNFKQQSC